jgi:ABC-2 type transport system permease protein
VTGLAYTRFELRRTFRNRRFLFFSLGFPIALFFLIAGPNRGEHDLGGTGISAPLYYMVALAAFGTMMGMVSTGARIAGERQVGWTRQLRVTPLSSAAYLRAKVITAYATAGASVAALYLAGASLGVSIPARRWAEMTLLIAIGLMPFAALGIFLGHLLNVDSIGPATGGSVTILAFVGVTWFPVTSGVLRAVGRCVPSYWLVQAAHVALGGDAWGARGFVTVIAWTVVLSVAAAWAYRRDTGRT